jgi:hypothetical protein
MAAAWGWLTPLHCARDIVLGDLARHLATGSEAQAGDRSYVLEARWHFMKPLDKPSGWRSWIEWSGHPSGFEKWVSRPCRGTSHRASERIDCTQLKNRRYRSTNHSQKCHCHSSEEEKWWYACRLLGMNSFKKGAMWHVSAESQNFEASRDSCC